MAAAVMRSTEPAANESLTWKEDLYGGCVIDPGSGPQDPTAFAEALRQAMQVQDDAPTPSRSDIICAIIIMTNTMHDMPVL